MYVLFLMAVAGPSLTEDPLLERAGSLQQFNGVHRGEIIGCQTAIAGKPRAHRGSGRGVQPDTGKGLDMNSLIRDRNQRSAGSLSCTPLQAIDSCAASIGNGGSSARNAQPSTNAHAA